MAKIPYEVSEDECMSIVEITLKMPNDLNEKRFGTYDEIMERCVGNKFNKSEDVPKGKKARK